MVARLSIRDLRELKDKREPIAMVTAYDATFARHLDAAGAEMLLVGDSLGMVIQGHDSTLPVTVDDMIYHTRAVVRGSRRALVVADMPFMSYQPSVELALINAGRLLGEGGAQAVKIEGGESVVATTRALVRAGVPVMGHLGLTPQAVHALGGFRVQARSEKAAARLLEDAMLLQEAGAFAIVLETIPTELARNVTERLSIPTIGIGAGPGCDGQVLVCYDLLGLFDQLSPKFVKRYATIGDATRQAVKTYVDEVKARTFPGEEHSFK
jgi:3-methyl-2-oxobutanoate hydroxymethyltransferase